MSFSNFVTSECLIGKTQPVHLKSVLDPPAADRTMLLRFDLMSFSNFVTSECLIWQIFL